MSDMVGTYAKEYYFDYPVQHPVARFIMISPGLNFTYGGPYSYVKGGADYNWVANAIDSARAAGIKWIIVANHKVCLSAGGSTCDGGTDILNLLVSKKVDIILMGHDHIYQRSKQLALSARCPALDPNVYNGGCVVNSGFGHLYHAGAGTIINGLGTGGDGPDFGYVWTRADTPYFARYSGYNLDVRKGFEKFTVTNQAITAQFIGVNPAGGPTSPFSDSYTITSNPVTPSSPALNSDGTIFENNLDGQPTGNLIVHQGTNQFTLVGTDCYGSDGSPCPNPVTVESQMAYTAPNAVGIDVTGGGSGFLWTQYDGAGYSAHSLFFHVRLGDDFVLGPNEYLVLANTTPDGASLILTASGNLLLDYADSVGAHHYVYTSATLSPGASHSVGLAESMSSGTSGAVTLTIDGTVVGSSSNIDLGIEPVIAFSVGNEYTPPDLATRGHIYVDDVRSTPSGPAANAATPTPTTPPASSPTPSSTSVSTSTPTPPPTSTPTLSPSPTSMPAPTSTPTVGVVFVNTFDQQPAGPLQTGSEVNVFSGEIGSGQLAVQNAIYSSPPQSMEVSSSGGGSAYAYRTLTTGLRSVQFSIKLGSDFVLPAGEYMVVAQMGPSATGGAGTVSLILSGGGLFLDYRDSGGAQRYVWSAATLSPGPWHTIRIDESAGDGTGTLSLSEDGVQQGAASGLLLGTLPADYLALGMEYSPPDSGTAGHLYVDDVTAS